MRPIERVFLAGPDRFAPGAPHLLARQREACAAAGLVAVQPPALESGSEPPGELQARMLYAETISQVRGADAVIANLSPWRGAGCDPATAYLTGFAAALGKPVFAYLNVADQDEADHRDRVDAVLGAVLDDEGVWRDPEGAEIEDFGLPEGALLWAEARRFYVIVTPEPLADLTGLDLCLQALLAYAD
jgi:nucleoside 2-deoxyribosyltransferase